MRIAPREIGRHAMVWGSSGAGKSYGLHIITEGWVRAGRPLEIIDPKGETFLLKAVAVAAAYRELAEEKRERFAARFAVYDVTEDRVTPADLWSVPEGMSPSLLASLRTAATCDVSSHSFSDLMAYGMFLVYSVAIHLGWGVTVKIARAFFFEVAFRERIAGKIKDARLRDSVLHLETTLPEQTRKAIVRQFDILLASAPARISFGLSSAMTRELLPHRERALVTLGNFGATPQRPPALAKAMATNRLIDVLTEANVRRDATPEMLLLEEVGVLVKQPVVAEYLLEASRTLRWKGLSIVCVAQDPANAIPKETCTALILNSKWLLSFECGREEALWLLPHMSPGTMSETEERRAFIAEMAKLPTQEAVFVRKGRPGFRLRMRDVADPARGKDRPALLDTFSTKIAARSMVRIADAEERIARFEASLFDARETPVAASRSDAAPTGHRSLDDFFDLLKKARIASEGE
ncbi:MAG: type IV secretory system conjugative DNA transfer family protein [Acidobacteriota bacterium]|nr:type IV secretory system conjugative DNA transfer family protein [Acidobacteriota bacterium]